MKISAAGHIYNTDTKQLLHKDGHVSKNLSLKDFLNGKTEITIMDSKIPDISPNESPPTKHACISKRDGEKAIKNLEKMEQSTQAIEHFLVIGNSDVQKITFKQDDLKLHRGEVFQQLLSSESLHTLEGLDEISDNLQKKLKNNTVDVAIDDNESVGRESVTSLESMQLEESVAKNIENDINLLGLEGDHLDTTTI